MLHRVLLAFETATTPISLDELSRQLEIERSALEGMIDFLVRKGRLKESGGTCPPVRVGCTCRAHPGGCAFDTDSPRTITLLKK